MLRRRAHWLLLVLALSVWPALPVNAAPREELLQLVPEDIGLCLVVNNLRDHTQTLKNAPWVAGLRQTELGKSLLQAPELQQLVKIDQELQRLAKIGWPDLRDDILGDCLVFAFHAGKTKQDERGVLMLWAKNPKLLAKLLDVVNQEQKDKGEIKGIEEKEHRGIKYMVRLDPKQKQFYLHQDSLFIFTTDEPMLRQVIDRKAAGAAGPTPLMQSFERLGATPALVTFWVNPRPLDALWKPSPQDNADTAAAKEAFAQYWKALDAIAMTVTVGKDLELGLALQGRPNDLPAPVRKFLQTAVKPSELWQQFPTKSVVTAAGRVDAPALLEMLEQFAPSAERPKLHQQLQQKIGSPLSMDFAKDVLPRLGPDFGFCIAPNPDGKALPDLFFALRIQKGPAELPLGRALLNKLELIPFGFNTFQKDPVDLMKLLTEQQNGVEVKYLSQRHFPAGFQPAFALKDGYFVMASSPQAIGRFGANAAKVKDNPLLRLSFAELADLLKTQRKWIVENVGDKKSLPDANAGTWLDQMLEVLALLDNLHVRQEFTPGQAAWTVRVQTKAGTN